MEYEHSDNCHCRRCENRRNRVLIRMERRVAAKTRKFDPNWDPIGPGGEELQWFDQQDQDN